MIRLKGNSQGKNNKIMSENNDKKALKAGVWYIVCSFINKGIAFLTTPIFTRILTKNDIGEFNNFIVWLNLFTLLLTMDMHVTIPRAKYDFKNELDKYVSSITVLSTIVTIVFTAMIGMFITPISSFLEMNKEYVWIMMLTIMFTGAFQIFMMKLRIYYKYKLFVFLTIFQSVSSVFLALWLVKLCSNPLLGRIVGYAAPRVIIPFILFLIVIYQGKCFINKRFWSYALKIALPYVPHLIALNILSASDRIMIKKFCGAEDVAIYSIGYSCAVLLSLVYTSLNQAWQPWLNDQLANQNYDKVKRASKYYQGVFLLFTLAMMLIGPELILILGGASYRDAISILPPIIAGVFFQFSYSMYVNIEIYEKKTKGISLATGIACLANVVLNFLFIPICGYIAAAYTTLVGYMILFVVHYVTVKRMRMSFVYDTKTVVTFLGGSLFLMLIAYLLYINSIIRYGSIGFVLVVSIVLAFKFKASVFQIVNRFKKKRNKK